MSAINLTGTGETEIVEKSSRVFLSLAGTFGTAAVSIGFYTDPTNPASFRAFTDLANQTAPFDKVIFKGSGLRLIAKVINAGGTDLELIHTPVN